MGNDCSELTAAPEPPSRYLRLTPDGPTNQASTGAENDSHRSSYSAASSSISGSPGFKADTSAQERILHEERIEWIRVIHSEIFQVTENKYLKPYTPYCKITSYWSDIFRQKAALERVESLLREGAACDAIKVREHHRRNSGQRTITNLSTRYRSRKTPLAY